MAHFSLIQHKHPEMYRLCLEVEKYFYEQKHELTCFYSRKFCEAIVADLGRDGVVLFPSLKEKIEHLRSNKELKDKLHFLRTSGNKSAHNEVVCSEDARKCYQYVKEICTTCYGTAQNPQANPSPLGFFLGLFLGAVAVAGGVHAAQQIKNNTKM